MNPSLRRFYRFVARKSQKVYSTGQQIRFLLTIQYHQFVPDGRLLRPLLDLYQPPPPPAPCDRRPLPPLLLGVVLVAAHGVAQHLEVGETGPVFVPRQ